MIRPNGRKKITAYIRPDQYVWLRVLALEHVVEKGAGRPDASALLEGMIDFYKQAHDNNGKRRRNPDAQKQSRRA